ncbi:hypothetical protein ACL43R_08270 [Lactococcus formosensis]|uniref:hypothetical protein n=1 Tax=Lactococcus formosensis TaxID=1281486 RepID=UPI0039F6B347
MKLIEQFFEGINKQLQGDRKLGLFYIGDYEAIEFLFDYCDDLEREAPLTNDYLQTSDFSDWLDGYIVDFNIDMQYQGVQKCYEKALKIYKKEMNNQVNMN